MYTAANMRGKGRPLREGVGRNRYLRPCEWQTIRRPLREGVGRNCYPLHHAHHLKVALYARAWVEIGHCVTVWFPAAGRPLREGVGRNPELGTKNGVVCRSPSTRGRG